MLTTSFIRQQEFCLGKVSKRMITISEARILRAKLQEYLQSHEDDDNTDKIALKTFFDPYVQYEYHNVGDIRLDEMGTPYECITAYDGSVQYDWTIHTATLWKPYHSTSVMYALP